MVGGCFTCFRDLLCSQWVIVTSLLLLFAVYITPKILVIVLSSFLSKFIPCILTVQRFGFIWAHGITITFISGECMCVNAIHLSSSLWNTKAKTLLSAVVTSVELHVTDIGLRSIVKVIRRKSDGVRGRLDENASQKCAFKSWRTRLISFLSVDISSVQIIVLSTKFLDETYFLNFQENVNSNNSVCHVCFAHMSGSSGRGGGYQPIQSGRKIDFPLNKTSKFALTFQLTKLTMLFHVNMRQAHINLRISHICGKLLCMPIFQKIGYTMI
ncbi:unnamed protein product [Heterobilharzia americana]|nr:unnamed protein product [Heterobilharzia americana]